jgi:hypothetical protein
VIGVDGASTVGVGDDGSGTAKNMESILVSIIHQPGRGAKEKGRKGRRAVLCDGL